MIKYIKIPILIAGISIGYFLTFNYLIAAGVNEMVEISLQDMNRSFKVSEKAYLNETPLIGEWALKEHLKKIDSFKLSLEKTSDLNGLNWSIPKKVYEKIQYDEFITLSRLISHLNHQQKNIEILYLKRALKLSESENNKIPKIKTESEIISFIKKMDNH